MRVRLKLLGIFSVVKVRIRERHNKIKWVSDKPSPAIHFLPVEYTLLAKNIEKADVGVFLRLMITTCSIITRFNKY